MTTLFDGSLRLCGTFTLALFSLDPINIFLADKLQSSGPRRGGGVQKDVPGLRRELA